MNGASVIRDAARDDEAAWRHLWNGYTAFYEAAVAPQVTSWTWQRILDPSSPVIGRVAEQDGTVAGFTVSVLHEATWFPTPVCYLEDLFVAPASRGDGIGRQLVQDLVGLTQARGWSCLYWHTHEHNPARRLYDEFTKADGFVRYRLPNKAP